MGTSDWHLQVYVRREWSAPEAVSETCDESVVQNSAWLGYHVAASIWRFLERATASRDGDALEPVNLALRFAASSVPGSTSRHKNSKSTQASYLGR
jgi:hypothetical protein